MTISTDPHHLDRFIQAQALVYAQVLTELQAGQKQTHWMWYIFPQLAGLGHSETAKYYAIKNTAEAIAYLQHPILGQRLQDCTTILLNQHSKSVIEILGTIDSKKFRSCITLFAELSPANSVFHQALNKYFQDKPDQQTLSLLQQS
ncbi:DUF1810 domain-containing protein [Synechococcus moorigangaii CMS01]|nr:DUF1810 domain-containing protein [Synechococcus moorigangaii CMS01]